MPTTTKQAPIVLRSVTLTDVGMVREHNEDSACIDKMQNFFIVADGMGGHAAGEVASAMAVEGVCAVLDDNEKQLQAYASDPAVDSRQEVAQILDEAVRDAHKSVFDKGSTDPEKQGMGTTLDVLLISGQQAFVAHVGDSRIYLMRGDEASQLTTDHTAAEVLVIKGELSAEEALISPYRNVLVNALGVSPDIIVEMAHLTLQKGDRFLLCSDGLHDYFPNPVELYDQVTTHEPEQALQNLIDTAKERGGHDNITGIIVEVLDAPEVKDWTLSETEEPSNGVPDAISNDDTAPVEEAMLATIEQEAANRPSTEPLSDAGVGDADEAVTEDLRKTMPIIRTILSQEGLGVSLEIDDEDEDSEK